MLFKLYCTNTKETRDFQVGHTESLLDVLREDNIVYSALGVTGKSEGNYYNKVYHMDDGTIWDRSVEFESKEVHGRFLREVMHGTTAMVIRSMEGFLPKCMPEIQDFDGVSVIAARNVDNAVYYMIVDLEKLGNIELLNVACPAELKAHFIGKGGSFIAGIKEWFNKSGYAVRRITLR